MKVLVIEPKEEVFVPDMVYPHEIAGDLASMQGIIGGYIEMVRLPNSEYTIVCDEEGLLKNLPKNILGISGNCFICKSDGAEMVGLTDLDIEITIQILSGFTDVSYDARS